MEWRLRVWFHSAPAKHFVPHAAQVCDQGRTGVVVACYMMLSGLYNSPDLSPRRSARLALEHFLHMRGEGVNYPSQKRYVEYFAEVHNSVWGVAACSSNHELDVRVLACCFC